MRCSLSLRTGKDEGMDLLDDHKKAIDGIFRRSQDSYGFIPYRAAATFHRSVQEFLATTFKGLMDSDEGLAAFKILAYLYHKLAEQPIDDSGGEIVELAERLFVLWQGLIRHADRSGKKTMFSWFGDQIKERDSRGYLDDKLQDTFLEEFSEPDLLYEKLKIADVVILRNIEKTQENEWASDYALQMWVVERIKIMRSLDLSAGEIAGFQQEFWHLSKVRKDYIQQCLEAGNHEAAIRTLKKSKELDADLPGLTADYRSQLASIYKEQGDLGKLKEELWEIVHTSYALDPEQFWELKALYPKKEWEKVREDVFEAQGDQRGLYPLLLAEGLLERILSDLQARVTLPNNLYFLELYKEDLKPYYAKELLGIFQLEVMDLAKGATNRSGYRRVVGALRDMQEYPGGAERARDLAQELKETYPRRTAMLDELAKL